MAFNLGFGKSSSSSSSFIDPAQQPFLDFLRNTGQGLVGQTMPGAQQFAQQQGGQLFGQGLDFLGGLQNNPFIAQLFQQAQGSPDLVNQQVGQLQADLGRAFQQEVLPGIRRDATAVGALGGSRQGVAEGIAGQGFADAFSRGVTGIQTAAADRALQAGTAGAGIQAQSLLGGLSSLPGLLQLGLGQFTGQFAPLSLFSDIVGGPTVLDRSRGRSFNASGGFRPDSTF